MSDTHVIPSDLKDVVGFDIRLAHGAVFRHLTEAFADLGLTRKQVSVSAIWGPRFCRSFPSAPD